MNAEKKAIIVADAKQMMQQWYDALPPTRGPITHYCLWWADFTVKACRKHGLTAQIQAGDAFWRTIRPEDDDGVRPLNWGFEFQNTMESIFYASQGLPELHVWAAAMQANEAYIIDLTAPFFKQRSLEYGQQWTMPDPPEYLWASVKDFPADLCYYIPKKQAIAICYSILNSFESGIMAIPVLRS